MPSGGSQKVTNETKLSPEQKKLIASGMKLTDQVTGGPLPSIPGPADFNAAETGAQAGIMSKTGAGGAVANTADSLGDAQKFLLGDVMSLENNKGMKGAIDAATRPLTEQFQQVIKPGLAHNSMAGEFSSFGNLKNAHSNNLADSTYLKSITDASNRIVNDTYTANLDALVKGVGLAPGSMQAQLFPETAQSAVGQTQRELQAGKDQAAFENKMLPFNMGLQLLGGAGATPGGGSQTTGAQPGGGIGQIAGTAMTAAKFLPLLFGMPPIGI